MLKNIFFVTLFIVLNQVNAQYEKGDSLRNIGAYQKAILAYQQIDDSSKTEFKIAQVYHSMGELAAARLSDLKKEVFMEGDSKN